MGGGVMDHEEMKAKLAENLYGILNRLTDECITGEDFFSLLSMEKQEQITWLFDEFLKLAPDYYAAALRASNTAEGKTVSEILERQAAGAV